MTNGGILPTLAFGLLAEGASLVVWRGWATGITVRFLGQPRFVRLVDSPASFWFWWCFLVLLALAFWILGGILFRDLIATRGPGAATFVGLLLLGSLYLFPSKKP